MNPFKTAFLLFTLIAQLPLLADDQEEAVRRYRPKSDSKIVFAVSETKDPVFPLHLRRTGVDSGTVTYAISVNPVGDLEDYLLIEATHLDFAQSVENVLPEWQYSVPLVDGEPAAIVSRVTVKFKRGSGVLYETSGYETMSQQLTHSGQENEGAYRVFTLKELDRIPNPRHVEKPSFHVDLLEERELVNAVFRFYIDEEGKVRIPTLSEADEEIDERLLLITQEALLKWRFDPPLKDGKPVVVQAAQPFRLKKRSPESASLQ